MQEKDWKTSDDPESFARRIRANMEEDWYPLTYSRIDRFKTCPLWFKFENIDKLGRIGGEAADLGNAAHALSELIQSEGLERALQVATAMVPLTKAEQWKNARQIIQNLVTRKEHLYGVEKRFLFDWPIKRRVDGRTIRIQFEGKIDQLFLYPDGVAEVVDGKSGRNVSANIDHDPQGGLYAVAVTEAEELKPFGIWKVIFTQAQWASGQLVTTSYSLDEISNFKQQLEEIAQVMVDEKEFKPKPGTHCMYCPFVTRCDAAQKLLPEEYEFQGIKLPLHIEDETEGQIVDGIIQLEAVLKRYKDALRGRVKETGQPATGTNGAFDFTPVKQRDLDKLMNNHPELEDEVVYRHYSKFEYKKKD